ncbi:MAG: glycosyltransferase [Myxococcota bacterium]
MILVACGTHHQPFDRLVLAARQLARHHRVVLQRGASRLAAPGCEVHDEVPPQRFATWLREARIVVLHAGSSSFLEARAFGRTPILVPRRPELGEHVDDHQIRFAESVATQARVIEPDTLCEVVRRFVEPRRSEPEAPLAKRFAALMDAWQTVRPPERR